MMRPRLSFKDDIATDVEPFVARLETATQPENLGRAYFEASKEAARLSFGWPLLEFSQALSCFGYLLVAGGFLRLDQPMYLVVPGAIFTIAAISTQVIVQNSPRGRALERLGNATGRWMHAVPAMKESPDKLSAELQREAA